MKELDQNDIVSNELTLRLLGVMQSLDTEKYYQKFKDQKTGNMIKETESEAITRLNKSLDKNMDSIQDTFNQMDHAERVLNYKRKTRVQIIESPIRPKAKKRNKT
jgi:Na+/phosphate symporter